LKKDRFLRLFGSQCLDGSNAAKGSPLVEYSLQVQTKAVFCKCDCIAKYGIVLFIPAKY